MIKWAKKQRLKYIIFGILYIVGIILGEFVHNIFFIMSLGLPFVIIKSLGKIMDETC